MTDIDFDIRMIIQDILRETPEIGQIELLCEVEERLEKQNKTEHNLKS